ncbi:5'-methylthioadenosine/adenosylhomocysteine nucleosidase [Bacillus pseudomycoides]|uniref:5'-methylthioadenosine/adenosylhomocysteine nucleosidase n=1 Tax=Bacillus pseudomycoides TaxID=64104 RepID=UPI000BEC66E3|nr:5'-methylthioadenosine/adenosylhomocysteine nucleosidase [Bacillus pseudomycoides]PED05957.1 5'-methylthioadenosine nucleosidase [Bacillus pseudomycoides]PED70956.1 5'-methylthioadenosine nucleosidase [Bacillus pseudomycoides]PEI36233.1 5'-methylthioadenosine nucleosidase [Bacillus pseudomycoides]PEJ81675.1 5'-methylthioadenosine nucleosidase [Bacillus pseudomycoides]PEK16247.1 5'-methylthioadenosine nucleosidase [Bacillus pseudomycoides]
MKKVGIIGAMQIEIDLLLEKLDIYEEYTIARMPFYKGIFMDKEIIVTRCGIGKVNAASCAQILIDKFEVDCVINTGIAGGLHPDVKVGDLVISTNVTHHDVNKNQMKNLFPFQETFIANQELRELARKACNTSGLDINVHEGRIVSGECFVEDAKLKEKLLDEYAPHCTEMEGSAIGHVAFINDIPFLIIRSISDSADDDATSSYENFAKITADQSSRVIMEMIKNISSNTVV